MNPDSEPLRAPAVLFRDGFDGLLNALRNRGYQLVGPTVRDGAIILDKIETLADLPSGWTDEQDAGRYRLSARSDDALFAHAAPAHSWKSFLRPPSERLLVAEHDGATIHFSMAVSPARPLAFIGIRPCDLAALTVFDRPFLNNGDSDVAYKRRREGVFTVVVQCDHPASTCFCGSFSTGPHVTGGCDIAVTELLSGKHRFVVEAFSNRGVDVLNETPCEDARAADLNAVAALHKQALKSLRRSVDVEAAREALSGAFEHPRWAAASAKCLACGNCTMICPTCFCNTIEDDCDLTGQNATRRRVWDSCFSLKFSYIHGGSVRASVPARFRQRILHKFVWEQDQFGAPGCVGCGRCIAWCPVGIDITHEVKAFQKATV